MTAQNTASCVTRRLVKAITDAMIEHADCKPDHLHVIIQDVPKESWGRAGKLGIDHEPGAAPRKSAKAPSRGK